MQILFLVTNDLTYDQRMIRICNTLAKAGYAVRLVGRVLPNSQPLKKETFEQHRLFCFFKKGKFFYVEFNIRLFFYLLWHRFDVVCAIDLDTILPAYALSKLRQKKIVYDAHEYFTEVPEVVHRPFTKRIWETVARWTIPNIKHCYTVGPSLAAIMSKRYGVDFEVIRNVPEVASPDPSNLSRTFSREGGEYVEATSRLFLFGREYVEVTSKLPSFPTKCAGQVGGAEGGTFLLYQGALNEGRGIEALIQVMQYLEGIELWLAGEGDLSEALRDLTQKLNVTNKVKFLGRVTPNELKKLTPKAWIGLNLLENRGLSYYYSLANKTFDYVQATVPSINMAFPEYQRLNQEYEVSILLNDLEVKTILEAIQTLLNDKETYHQLQNNCKKAALVWNWEQETKKLLRFYQKI